MTSTTPFSTLTVNVPGLGIDLDNVTYGTAAAAVPEPASWAMMILGLGVTAFGLGRRRRAWRIGV